MLVTYSDLAASGSLATVSLWKAGFTVSGRSRARNGPVTLLLPERSTYRATGVSDICLRARSKRPNPKRSPPVSSCETVGASTGPGPRPFLISRMVLPLGEGKSAELAGGWEEDVPLSDESELPHATRAVESAASSRAVGRRRRDTAAKGTEGRGTHE